MTRLPYLRYQRHLYAYSGSLGHGKPACLPEVKPGLMIQCLVPRCPSHHGKQLQLQHLVGGYFRNPMRGCMAHRWEKVLQATLVH